MPPSAELNGLNGAARESEKRFKLVNGEVAFQNLEKHELEEKPFTMKLLCARHNNHVR